MMDLDGRRRAAADNLVDAFDLVRRHYGNARGGRQSFGTVEVAAVGHEVAFYNAVVAQEREVAVDDVLAAVDWVESRGLAPCVHLAGDADPAVGRRLAALGMRPAEERATVMVLDPIPPAPSAGPDLSAGAAQSGGLELAEQWYTALQATSRFRATFGRGFVADPDVRIGVAELAGEPVAAAMAMRTGSVLGVYAVGTIERARRRGLGRAVTRAVIDAGVDAWQSRMAILQSSEMGRPLYRSMGFEEIGTITTFSRPDEPA
jgi:ribosomal protein S18 acetylase RimI-like enzyme